jgi:hypothetical protein
MRQRLLVGLGVTILVLVSVVMALSLAFAPDHGPAPHGSPSSALVTPVPGACLPGIPQCSPVVPRPSSGAGPVLALIGILVGTVLVAVGRTRVRHRRPTGHLPLGFVPALLHPPQAGLGTI